MKPTHTMPTDPDLTEGSYFGFQLELDERCERDYFNATNRITVKRFRIVSVLRESSQGTPK